MHYAGRFTDSPNKQYVKGEIYFVDMIYNGEFKIELVNTVLSCLGYEDDDDLLLYYQIPLKSLDIRLKPLVSDIDISNFLGFVNKHKMMYVYVEQVEKTESSSDEDGEGDIESEDVNCFIDEEHLVNEVEVNMNSFKFQIDGEDDTEFIDPIQPHVNVIEDDLEVLDFDSLESKEFPNRDLAKKRIRSYAVETRRNLDFKRNDKRRIRVVCNGVVPTLNSKNEYVDKVQGPKPDTSGKGKALMQNLKEKKITCPSVLYLSKGDKSKWAKAKAHVYLRGDVKVQYSLLRNYANELQRCNLDTTVKIDVYGEEDSEKTTRMFRRIYVCLGALKRGFKEGGRELLGLDGAFMRGQYSRQMLTAVGVDANNGIYPVAYSIVESENQYSWTWFLTCLADDFDLFSNSNFTFITDRQKGLLPTIAKLFPSAEHRFCVRHINENMNLTWKGGDYKEMLWRLTFQIMVWMWGAPEDQVHESYKLQTWMDVYSYKINPVNGRDMWSKFECPTTLIPPKVYPQIRRPPKRKKEKQRMQTTGSSDGGLRYDMPSETMPSQPLGNQQVATQGVSSQPLVSETVGSQAGPSEVVARKSFTIKSTTRKSVTRKRAASEIIQVAQAQGDGMVTWLGALCPRRAALPCVTISTSSIDQLCWAEQYGRGDKTYPTIMLEVVASHDLWIWHAFFGVAGTNNDINVLDNSSLFDDLLDDIALVTPFMVSGVGFENAYYLAGEIYPHWASFVKSFTVANDEKHSYFKKRQESAPTDVERAFGVLQGRCGIIQQSACQ
ncbi:FAR1-related sequence 10 [Tanacetum coccineum]